MTVNILSLSSVALPENKQELKYILISKDWILTCNNLG